VPRVWVETRRNGFIGRKEMGLESKGDGIAV
jgi:hypothetical protein